MKSNLKAIFTLLFCACLWMGSSSVNGGENSESVLGISAEKIEEIFAIYDGDKDPGCAVAIYNDGESIYKNAFGISNLDYGIALSDSSSFYMASVSKHVTAAAAGLLVIRGKLDEQAHVSEYIEGWPEFASDVTVGQLFNHTSGLPDIYGLMNIAGINMNNPMDIEDYMEVIRNGESLTSDPGTAYSYTNSGYTALAHLVEIITEKPFGEFADDEFFSPFGMNATHYHSDRLRVIPNRVISYQRGGGHFRRTYLGMFQGVGAGGLYSTLNDWEKWEAFWIGNLEWNGGITPEEAGELKGRMTESAQIDGETLDYGWGIDITKRKGQEVMGHGGSFMGFQSDYRRYPQQGISFLTLCNRGDANPQNLNNRLTDLFLQDEFETFLGDYAGTYRNDELPIEYELTIEGGNLKLNRRNSPNGIMAEQEEDIWRAGSWDFVFERDESGNIKGFLVSTGRAVDVEFSKVQ